MHNLLPYLIAVGLEDICLFGLDLLVDEDADGLEACGLLEDVVGHSMEPGGDLG